MRLYKYKAIETDVKDILKSRRKKAQSQWDRILYCLKNNQIWFSDLNSLNDPFEFAFKANLNGREWGMDFKGVRDSFNEKIVVFSSCAIKDNPVLWALYANRYKGLAFEFNCDDNDEFHPVIYDEEPHNLNVVDFLHGKSVDEAMAASFAKNCFLRKSKSWKQEEEFRSLKFRGRGYYSLSQPDAISKIILGHFVSDEMTSFILNEVKHLNKSRMERPVLVEKCRIPESGWEIKFDVLDYT